MCGIAGILYLKSASHGPTSVGADLVKMLHALRHRGIDSTGVTVAGQTVESDLTVRLCFADGSDPKKTFESVDRQITALGGKVLVKHQTDAYLKLNLDYKGEAKELARCLLSVDGVVIHSMGRSSEVVKDVGDANRLDGKHYVSSLLGTHGIGHVRLATESQVDISHSHPFWAYPYPDITLVHNGQLTNYHNLKRYLKQKGHRFLTHNDSEVIAVYLADQLEQGTSLDEALHNSLRDLDGTFTYVVSTPTGIGMAKDKWSAKPLVVMETEAVIAVASEEVALRRVFPDEIERIEPQQNEVMSWSI